MSRLADTVLAGAFSQGRSTMVNPKYGGQFGYAPNLGEWVSNTSYVRRNLVCLLLEAPRFFNYMPEPNMWISTLKALFETHAQTWDGLKGQLNVESAETPVGGGGEMHQDPVNVTRERSEPTLTVTDRYGRPFQNFFQDWITYGIGDPDNKIPQVYTIAGTRPEDHLADIYAATALFFEPDPTHTKVNRAWLCANMYPTNAGTYEGKKDPTNQMEKLELNIPFTAETQHGLGPIMFAQAILDRINLTGANPNMRPAFLSAIAADVEAQGLGWKAGGEQLAATAIRP